MKRFLILLLAVPAFAQSPVIGGSVQYVTTAPSGACVASPPVKVLFSTGVIYTCDNGIWAASGGGGGPTFAYPTGTGLVRVAAGAAWGTTAELSGDATTSGSNAVTVVKINGIAVTGTPAVGNVPTATSSSAATWQAPAAAGNATPYMVGFVKVQTSGAAAVSSQTTPGLVVAVNDWVLVWCRGATNSQTVTSSPSETWHALTGVSNSAPSGAQASWALIGTAGSHTFTCTKGGTEVFSAVIAVAYRGTAGTVNASVGTSSNTGSTSLATGTLTVTGRALIVNCYSTSTAGNSFAPATIGTIAGSSATLRVTDFGSPQDTSATAACSDLVLNGAMALTATPTAAASNDWLITTVGVDW